MPATAFKVEFHYNCGQQGWGEEVIWYAADGSYADCVTDCKGLTNKRLQLSLAAVKLAGVSFQQIPLVPSTQTFSLTGVRPSSYTEYDWGAAYQIGQVSGTNMQIQNTYFLRARNDDRSATRGVKLKGIADIYMMTNSANLFATPTNANAVKALADYIAYLSGPNTNSSQKALKGAFMIASRIYRRNPAVRSFIDDIGTVVYRNKSMFQITVSDGTWAPGDRVHVGGVTGNGINGLNGDATVLQKAVAGGQTLLTLNRGPKTGGDVIPIKYGQVSPIFFQLTPITACAYVKSGESKVGRCFGSIRGRR